MGWMAVITCPLLRDLAENGKARGQDQEAAAAQAAAGEAVRLVTPQPKIKERCRSRTWHAGSAP